MLDTPKKMFLLIGALEAAAQILGFIGAAKLPGKLHCMYTQPCPDACWQEVVALPNFSRDIGTGEPSHVT